LKKLIGTVAAFVLITAGVMLRPGNATQAVALSTVSAPMPQSQAACTFPTQMAATPEQTAWQLFVAATCPAGTQYPFIVWETWKEQDQVYQPTGALAAHQRFHVSPLAKKLGNPRRRPANASCCLK
jgi:hypothetical protein